MSEQYWQTLIAVSKDFVPSGAQVQTFLSKIVEMGVVPGATCLDGHTPSGQTRTRTNPFTLLDEVSEVMTPLKIDSIHDVAAKVEGLREYSVAVSGFGRPIIAPVAIDFDKSYAVEVRCDVFWDLRSTSHLHEDSSTAKQAVPYGKPCSTAESTGLFSNPHDLTVIEVPEAGCARFWIEFELGKFLFPKIDNDDLNLLNPVIVQTAERVFGIAFAQGCFWG